MLTILTTSSSFHQYIDLHQPPLIRIGPPEHLQLWTKMQRTQRTRHAMEGNDICSKFSGLLSVVGVYGCGHDEPEKSPPAAFQLLYHVQAGRIHEARTLTIIALSKGLCARQHAHFTTLHLRQYLPPGTSHLSSLCHWEPDAARTCEKSKVEAGSGATLGRWSS